MQENASSASAMSVCEIRMKFFLTHLRLRHAVPFSAMEAQFGWAGSAIQQWIKRMLKVLHGQLRPFHKGFLSFMGNTWQRSQIEQWKAFHVDVAQDYDRFIERIENKPNAVIDLHSFVGSMARTLLRDSNDIDEEGKRKHDGTNVVPSVYLTSARKLKLEHVVPSIGTDPLKAGQWYVDEVIMYCLSTKMNMWKSVGHCTTLERFTAS